MQDRFRFRAWDKKTKKMRDVNNIAFHNKRSAFDYDDSNLPKVVNLWGYDIINDKDMILHREIEDVILMQCTGLEDKNGKLIYEGDIVKETLYRAGTICDETYLAVVHDSCIFRFEPDMVFTDLYYHHHKVEVIGNIYENPELLNKEE